VNRTLLDFLHPDDVAMTEEAVQRMTESGWPIIGLRNHQKTRRGWRTVEWNCVPLADEDGRPSGLQATGRDVTEQEAAVDVLKLHAEALEAAKAKAERANRAPRHLADPY